MTKNTFTVIVTAICIDIFLQHDFIASQCTGFISTEYVHCSKILNGIEVLYDCFRSLDAVQQMNGISIVPEFPDEEIYVKCDEDQMARAFRNIIINGLKYSKKKITVACETNQKYVYDGNGINRDDIEHIFDRFYKGSDGGTGIGLSLANEIIHLHNGSVTAYNYLDGAVFEVKLPIID